LIVVEFSDRAGTVGLEGVDLRKVGGIDEEKSGGRSGTWKRKPDAS